MQVEVYDTNKMHEHILVCLSSSPSNEKLIRTAKQVAKSVHGRFTALYVQTPDSKMLVKEDRQRLDAHISLAEQLGAEIVTTHGDDVALQISEYARLSGVTKILIGRANADNRHLLFKRTLTERLIELSPNVEIQVSPDSMRVAGYKKRREVSLSPALPSLKDAGLTFAILSVCTCIGILFQKVHMLNTNTVMVYILGVLLTSVLTKGYVCGVSASIASMVLFGFFFTEPRLSFKTYAAGYPVTFIIMLIAAILTAALASRLKGHAKLSAQSAFRTQILFDTDRLLQNAKEDEEILHTTCSQLSKLFERNIVAYALKDEDLAKGYLYTHNQKLDTDLLEDSEKEVAAWVLEHKQHAGRTTTRFPDAKCLYLAIRIDGKAYGVVGIPMAKNETMDSFEYSILLSILNECALALDNNQILREKEQEALRANNEQLRANLLRSISHDLRTPLTSISGNADTLLYHDDCLDDEMRKQIYTDIYDDSEWLNSVVENLLSVTRFKDNKVNLNLTDQVVDEVISEALKHVSRKGKEHHISMAPNNDILLAKMDTRLIMQVILNLVENAVKYTPKGSNILIAATKQDTYALIRVKDDGPGVKEEMKPHLFEMFYTGEKKVADSRRSLGLGLSLCKSIVEAHGGVLYYEDNDPHGAIFSFTLPLSEVTINE